MSEVLVAIDAELIAALDAYRIKQSSPVNLKREDAVNVIVRDWLQGQGFLPLTGDSTVPTAAEAAKVPDTP